MALLPQGREMRVDPNTASIDDFPEFQKMKPEKAQGKIDEIHKGAEIRAQTQVFPNNRPCQDIMWVAFFAITALGTIGYGFYNKGALEQRIQTETGTYGENAEKSHDLFSVQEGGAPNHMVVPPAQTFMVLIAAGSLACLVSALGFVFTAHRAPGCVVWSSLVFGPAFTIMSGLAMMMTTETVFMIMGGVMIAIGFCNLACVFFCWKHLVPFMIKVTEVVSDVIEHHPCMLSVAVIGTFLGLAWTVSVGLSFAAIFAAHEQDIDMDNNGVKYSIVFVTSLIFAWGAGVSSNVCHTTYCGVFGRWYYSPPGQDSGTLLPSFMAAIGTSLGSICFGSFLVAIVRAMEAVARQMERDARSDGNAVLAIVACLLQCFIRCIGDILEYFNDWAYVQCAVRGVSYMEAVRITYSMMTCANMKYILSDLLLGSVSTMGAMIVAFMSAGFTALTGYFVAGQVAAIYGASIGFVIGIVGGSAALGIINSGVKTVLACWADDPRPLMQSHPQLHEEFNNRLQQNMFK
jgi:hypothetical protein